MGFLQTYNLAITPLSPIHIGCGEDFEPTNYIIDPEKKRLYSFDPSSTVLQEDEARQLTELAERSNLLGLHRFFQERAKRFQPYSHIILPVASGVATEYQAKLGKTVNTEGDGKEVFNKLGIERHAHSRNLPYIPGSSLKGAIRTALLDRLNNKKPVFKEEQQKSKLLPERLFGGDFAKSPLRLLKVADCMPVDNIGRQVLYAVNRYKVQKYDRKTGQKKATRGVVARKEVILGGQYRSLSGTITIHSLHGESVDVYVQKAGNKAEVPQKDLRPDLVRIAKDCNQYHYPRFIEELQEMLEANWLDPGWKNVMEKLFTQELKPLLDAGLAFLVRLGKYGGAESKTLSGVAAIKIMKGKVDGRQQFEYHNKTTTFWFSAPQENSQTNLIPFGWALVEINPQNDLPALKAWCEEKSHNLPDMAREYNQLAVDRAKAVQADEERRQQAEQMRLDELAEQEVLQRRKEELQKYPWREHLPKLEQAETWGDLQQTVDVLTKWLEHEEVATTLHTVAEQVRANFRKKWTPERDSQVKAWLAPAGLTWTDSTTADPVEEEPSDSPNRITEAAFKDYGDWLNRHQDFQINELNQAEATALLTLFKDWNLDNNKSWRKTPAKKEWWQEVRKRIQQLKKTG